MIMLSTRSLPSSPIPIGYMGENDSRRIGFDFSDWIGRHGPGFLSLFVQRPMEAKAYPAELTIADGVAIWKPSRYDTEKSGWGEIQYVYVVDNVVAKTQKFRIYVKQSLCMHHLPPDPWQKWAEEILAAAESISAASESIVVHGPIIQNGTWWLWDSETNEYVDTEIATSGDYEQLTNLPSINGVQLIGNLTLEQLGLTAGAGFDTYIHNQPTASAEWTINHHLGRYPSVTVIDSGGSVVVGDVQYVDKCTIIVRFQSAFSGKAYLN